MNSPRRLLAIVELGGYPNFTHLYRRLGYQTDFVNSQRKARSYLKKIIPDVVVAEYNYQSDFRDRTSNLETLMAVLQKNASVKVVVFVPKEFWDKFEQFRRRFTIHKVLTLPVDESQLEQALQQTQIDRT